MLASQEVLDRLSSTARQQISHIAVHQVIDSTNAELQRHLAAGTAQHCSLCLANQQTGGRGRRGRHWQSPAGASLSLSVLWHFPQQAGQLLGLSALTALAVVQALTAMEFTGCRVKWPNDILHQQHKLAGILLELAHSPTRHHTTGCWLIAGIGINIAMPDDAPIDQAWTDLQRIHNTPTDPNAVAATVLNHLLAYYQQVSQQQWPALPALWDQYDAYADAAVKLLTQQVTDQVATRAATSNTDISGIARGIDQQGALRLETEQGIKLITSGEVSLRRL